jgi:predicted nucleic acid-binding protein
LTELLVHPKLRQATTLEQHYRELLQNSRNFELLPIDVTIAEQAADLRARYHLRTPDALQIATALPASVGRNEA